MVFISESTYRYKQINVLFLSVHACALLTFARRDKRISTHTHTHNTLHLYFICFNTSGSTVSTSWLKFVLRRLMSRVKTSLDWNFLQENKSKAIVLDNKMQAHKHKHKPNVDSNRRKNELNTDEYFLFLLFLMVPFIIHVLLVISATCWAEAQENEHVRFSCAYAHVALTSSKDMVKCLKAILYIYTTFKLSSTETVFES